MDVTELTTWQREKKYAHIHLSATEEIFQQTTFQNKST